ncbi:hypothetical protein XENTR_v10020235 [Xenopus tropicalis]|nr:hypothetical protein XENTR_v10020235 [Xenopus tropicalis]
MLINELYPQLKKKCNTQTSTFALPINQSYVVGWMVVTFGSGLSVKKQLTFRHGWNGAYIGVWEM